MRDADSTILGHHLAELPKSALPAGSADEGGAFPFFCSSAEVKAIDQWLVDGEAVVMGTGGVASVNFGRGKFAYSTDCWAFRSRNGELGTEYLYRTLQFRLPQIDYAGFEGSGLRHLRKDHVRGLKIDAPDPIVQKRVVDILRAVDEAIEQTEALIAKTQAIKAGLMHDLFTRGVLPNGQLRPPREQAPELYKQSPLGWIPVPWEVHELQTVCQCDVTYGIVQAGPHIDGGVPYIRTGDMAGDRLDVSAMLRTSRRIADAYKRSEIHRGEIVCAIRATIGKMLPVPAELDGANLTQGTARIAPDRRTDGEYLLWCLRSDRVQREILTRVKGTTFGEITLSDLRKVRVAIPAEMDEQQLVARIMQAHDQQERSESENLGKLQNFRLGLMYDLLTGRVRVPTSRAQAADTAASGPPASAVAEPVPV